MFSGNFVNLYFAICIAVWILDIILVALAIIIRPFGRWLVRVWTKISFTLGIESYNCLEELFEKYEEE